MSVWNGRGVGVDVMAISLEMRDAVRQWETCRIAILDPGRSNVNFTNKQPQAFVWTGYARVQEYRREIAVAQVADPTTTASVRFQIDFSKDGAIPLIRTDYQIIVLTEAQGNTEQPDPNLSDYVYVVGKALNSSTAWIRTIETITNTQRRNDFQIIADGSGGIKWAP